MITIGLGIQNKENTEGGEDRTLDTRVVIDKIY